MRPWIIIVMTTIVLTLIAFDLFFFFEAYSVSASADHARVFAIVFTTVVGAMLLVYYGIESLSELVYHSPVYEKTSIANVRGVWVVRGVLLLNYLAVTAILWADSAVQNSRDHGDHDDDFANQFFSDEGLPLHGDFMFAAMVGTTLTVVPVFVNLYHYAIPNFAPLIMTVHMEKLNERLRRSPV